MGPARSTCRWLQRLGCVSFVLVTGVCLALLGCGDPVARHRVLTFFFDGVPPLEGSDVNGLAGSSPAGGGETVTSVWTVHPPVKDCTTCHGARRSRGAVGQVDLVAQPPALCDRCHTRPGPDQGWVHGPVVQGECMLCHEPHRTQRPALLRQDVPTLCFQCHDREAVGEIPLHDAPAYQDCLRCHVGHVSPHRALLRTADWEARLHQVTGEHQQYSHQQAEAAWASGRSLREMWAAAQQFLQRGDRVRTAAFLEVIKTSGCLPPGADLMIDQMLEDLAAQRPVSPGVIQALDQRLAEQERQVASLYYRSIDQMNQGQWRRAYEGLMQVLASGVLPQGMRAATQEFVESLEKKLSSGDATAAPSPQRSE